mgnify:CR=1 FL=1
MKINYSVNWVLQKVFAIIFLILFVYFLYSLRDISLNNFFEISNWFSIKANSILFLILFSSIILHSNIGLNSIIDDYIHEENNKKMIIILKNSLFVIIYITVLLSIISIS